MVIIEGREESMAISSSGALAGEPLATASVTHEFPNLRTIRKLRSERMDEFFIYEELLLYLPRVWDFFRNSSINEE